MEEPLTGGQHFFISSIHDLNSQSTPNIRSGEQLQCAVVQMYSTFSLFLLYFYALWLQLLRCAMNPL